MIWVIWIAKEIIPRHHSASESNELSIFGWFMPTIRNQGSGIYDNHWLYLSACTKKNRITTYIFYRYYVIYEVRHPLWSFDICSDIRCSHNHKNANVQFCTKPSCTKNFMRHFPLPYLSRLISLRQVKNHSDKYSDITIWTWVNSLRPSDACIYTSLYFPWLVQIIACRMVDAKPLSEPVPEHY